jgi:riboflavin biosynthesis pyrimidine reductase
LVVVTASGDLGASEDDAERKSALCITTQEGAERLRARGIEHLVVPGDGTQVAMAPALRALRERGMSVVLCEGGPSLLGQLIDNSLLDELFLTLSPRLFGRWATDGRMGLTHGADLNGRALELKSVRRAGSQLFLRYGAA